MKLNSIQQESIKNIILNCGCISAKDQTLIICDNTTKEIAKEFQNIASENPNSIIEKIEHINH